MTRKKRIYMDLISSDPPDQRPRKIGAGYQRSQYYYEL